MSEDNEIDKVTERSLAAYSKIEDGRVKEIVEGLIQYLHEYVKISKPTDQEWEFAWTFMGNMAKVTGDERNEFLLFADVTGVSQLAPAMLSRRPVRSKSSFPFLSSAALTTNHRPHDSARRGTYRL